MRFFIKIHLLLIISELIFINSCDCLKKIFNENDNNDDETNNFKSLKNCGQIFTGDNQYLIKSPNYPDNYKKNLDCVYKLIVNESLNDCNLKPEFKIKFLDFQIEESDNCSNDFLKIGKDNYYCGNYSVKNDQRFFSNDDNTIDIIFHSNENDINGKGFMILITLKKCDEISSKIPEALKRPSENFELPIFRSEHFHNDKCVHNLMEKPVFQSSSTPLITSYLYLPKKNFDQIPETNFDDTKKSLNLYFIPPNEKNSQPNSQRWSIYGVPDSLGQEFGNKNCWNNNNNNNMENKKANFDPGNQLSFSGYPEFPLEDSSLDPSFGVNINEAQWNTDQSFGIDDWIGISSNSECCSGSSYSSENFFISSPNFPSLLQSSNNYDCRYTIKKSSDNICKLNINLKYFNFGTDDQFCAYGYIEIDGQRYCGCRTGENITTNFDNISTKIISVKKIGKRIGKFFGFFIEVSQVSCLNGGDYYNNQFYGNKNLEGYFYNQGNSVSRMRNLFNKGSCRIFKFINWVKAAKQVLKKNARCTKNSIYSSGISSLVSVIPVFPENANSLIFANSYPSNQNCESVNVVEGTISSIYYPGGYPNDLNLCYRFIKAPGYCQLELSMIDFDLEESRSCKKDYVLFSGLNKRYCGVSLAGSRTIFDLTRSNYAEFYFVTDSSTNGRGFKIGFSQILCSGETPTSSSNSERTNYYY